MDLGQPTEHEDCEHCRTVNVIKQALVPRETEQEAHHIKVANERKHADVNTGVPINRAAAECCKVAASGNIWHNHMALRIPVQLNLMQAAQARMNLGFWNIGSVPFVKGRKGCLITHGRALRILDPLQFVGHREYRLVYTID